jgi:hypothetical protein
LNLSATDYSSAARETRKIAIVAVEFSLSLDCQRGQLHDLLEWPL